MPLTNLLTLVLTFLIGALLYRFRDRLLQPLRRFDARNQARRAEEARALFDRNAHYRQTMQLAEEQVEEVMKVKVPDERTGQPIIITDRGTPVLKITPYRDDPEAALRVLRESVVKYDAPTKPVADEEWESGT